jgi:uncharacterized membrane protein
MSKRKRKPAPPNSRPSTGKPAATPPSPDLLVAGLAVLGMLITGYLTGLAWLGESAAFCAEGSGCDVIRQSRWSTLLGLPVALWGFAVYAALGVVAWRMPPRLKRWRRLWYLALVGVAVSLYLTVVGIVALDAVCLWCLASLATISAIFVSVILRRPESAPGVAWSRWAAQSGVTAIAVVVVLHVWYSGLLAHPDTPRLTALAAHLEESGATYYGAWWCPACQEQKRLFRGAADRLPFVECSTGGRGSPMTLRCRDLGIEAYPTWIINGRPYTGVLTPMELAQYAGFGWE